MKEPANASNHAPPHDLDVVAFSPVMQPLHCGRVLGTAMGGHHRNVITVSAVVDTRVRTAAAAIITGRCIPDGGNGRGGSFPIIAAVINLISRSRSGGGWGMTYFVWCGVVAIVNSLVLWLPPHCVICVRDN